MLENGTIKIIDGEEKIYHDGYWIKRYEPPRDSLTDKKLLIQSLTRRLFNHMEHGINIPGRLLDKVRAAYEAEADPKKKRVKGAMLAGALFNRAADIFTQLVELEDCGVKIEPGNDLMHSCGLCLQEALEYGKLVKHRNGDEGIDELWGEPFKAFIMSIEDFYQSRYIKIAITMRNIDQVAQYLANCLKDDARFDGIDVLISEYATVAKRKCEILRTDDALLDVWADFVVAGEDITNFETASTQQDPDERLLDELDTRYLLEQGVKLISHITRARTAMPKSTEHYLKLCQLFKARCMQNSCLKSVQN
jgi:hypothetical protein